MFQLSYLPLSLWKYQDQARKFYSLFHAEKERRDPPYNRKRRPERCAIGNEDGDSMEHDRQRLPEEEEHWMVSITSVVAQGDYIPETPSIINTTNSQH